LSHFVARVRLPQIAALVSPRLSLDDPLLGQETGRQ
jgi:hypothetical protein